MASTVRTYSIYDKSCPSVQLRYPGLTGRLLQKRVMADYAFSDKHGDHTCDFFLKDVDGHHHGPRIVRHSLNNRDEHETRLQYTKIIEENGFIDGIRGQAWVVPSSLDLNTCVYELLSAATLTEAIYAAYERSPHNEQVISTIQSGLTHLPSPLSRPVGATGATSVIPPVPLVSGPPLVQSSLVSPTDIAPMHAGCGCSAHFPTDLVHALDGCTTGIS